MDAKHSAQVFHHRRDPHYINRVHLQLLANQLPVYREIGALVMPKLGQFVGTLVDGAEGSYLE
jgi:hypothetical protein